MRDNKKRRHPPIPKTEGRNPKQRRGVRTKDKEIAIKRRRRRKTLIVFAPLALFRGYSPGTSPFGSRLSEFIDDLVHTFAALVLSAPCATLTNSVKAAPSVAARSARTLRSKATFAAFNPSINRL